MLFRTLRVRTPDISGRVRSVSTLDARVPENPMLLNSGIYLKSCFCIIEGIYIFLNYGMLGPGFDRREALGSTQGSY